MNVLVVYLCFLLPLILAQSTTLQDVTLEWRFSPGMDPKKNKVKSSNDLNEYLPGIYLKVNGIVPIIQPGNFRNIQKLHSLTISGIGLKEIQAEAFQNLPHLERIECNSNNISEIKGGVFENLNVTYLDLQNDGIRNLEKGAFRNLAQLDRLNLNNNQLTEIGKEVFDNITPYRLDLSNNLISKLEAGVFGKIYRNGYYSLTLMLDNNKLREIDPEVFSNEKIVTLELRQNGILQLRPGDLKNMPKLYNLFLSDNQIKTISDNTLPENLQQIDLSNNQIAHISSQAFDGILYLKLLNLDHNQLTKWDPSWFPGSLRGESRLSAAYNYIEEIPDDAFKNIEEIWRLDLSKNHIRKVSPEAFRSSRRIETLLLNDNDIEEWDKTTVGTRDNLKITEINLKGNRFQCFQGDLKEIFRNVAIVEIDENPIRTNCLEKVEKYKKGG